MELAPLAGLADAIVDLVSTGSTLKANNLVAVEHIIDISSRLVVNQAALKLKREKIVAILNAIEGVVGKSPVVQDVLARLLNGKPAERKADVEVPAAEA